MLKAYKYRLYPNKDQQVLVEKHFGCARWIYNWALEQKIKTYQHDKQQIGSYALITKLPNLKKQEETFWLKEVNAQSLQQSITHLELAFDRFFREKKGFPKFKSKHNSRQSFACPQGVAVEKNHVYLPKIGWIKLALSRIFTGKIKTTIVSRVPSGKYFVSILVEDGQLLPDKQAYSAKTTIGCDLGLTTFAAFSNGVKVKAPKPLKKNLARLKREQRRLSRKKKGSNNRNKQRIIVARIHERVANIRKDFLHKLSTKLIGSENQAFAFETLNVQGMMKNHKLARAITDVSPTEFVSFCCYKADWKGKTILRIGQWVKSTGVSDCGAINTALTLKDRTWTCKSCGKEYDRDVQAAKIIKKLALHPENFNIGQGMPKFKSVELG